MNPPVIAKVNRTIHIVDIFTKGNFYPADYVGTLASQPRGLLGLLQ
jgi:hypothetical protein